MSPKEFLKTYGETLAAHDWERVSPLIHEDACATFSNGVFYKGKAEVRGAFERNFSLIQDEVYSIEDVYWVKTTLTYAVCCYTFHWQGVVNGKPASGSGRGTLVIVKEKGRWLLLSEHLGRGPKS